MLRGIIEDEPRPMLKKQVYIDYKGCLLYTSDVFDSEVKQREKNDYGFLLIPGNIVDNWKFVNVIKTEYFF